MIKTFKLFESNSDEVEILCKEYGIHNYKLLEDGSIDVHHSLNFKDYNLKSIPLKFNKIHGDFIISYNDIKSLEGCPKIVGGTFNCAINSLTSLKFCPEIINGNFVCYDNGIKDFGDKQIQFKEFICSENPIDEIYELNPCRDFFNYLIEYEVIREDKIIFKRLERALEDSGGEFDLFKNYKII